jgi:hypothetical protein
MTYIRKIRAVRRVGAIGSYNTGAKVTPGALIGGENRGERCYFCSTGGGSESDEGRFPRMELVDSDLTITDSVVYVWNDSKGYGKAWGSGWTPYCSSLWNTPPKVRDCPSDGSAFRAEFGNRMRKQHNGT